MRILYSPQLSMRSYRDNRWLLGSDAQLTKMTAYVEVLPPAWHHTWLMPEGSWHHEDRARFRYLPNVTLWPMKWPDNVLQHRFHFDMRAAIELLVHQTRYGEGAFDAMLCEVPEHVRAWRVAQNYAGVKFPIIAMYEHVDIYDETRVDTSFMLRQIEGWIEADFRAFPLRGMLDEWKKAASSITGPDVAVDLFHPEIGDYHGVWNGIFSPHEVQRLGQQKGWDTHIPNNAEPVVFFISRLSDNKRTHYEEFFEACRIKREAGDRFKVWVANPNEAKPWSWVEEQLGDLWDENQPWRGRTLKRDQYLELLWIADVVPILYPQSHIYSVGFCESIIANNVVITQEAPEGYDNETVGALVRKPDPVPIAATMGHVFHMLRTPELREIQLADQHAWLMEHRAVASKAMTIRDNIEEVVSSGTTTR